MNIDVQYGDSKTILELYDSKNNAFDIVRFILAMMVKSRVAIKKSA